MSGNVTDQNLSQTCHGGELVWGARSLTVTWLFNHVVLWFWFPLIQFVGLERKRLSRHRLFIVLRVIKFIVKYTLFYKQHFCKQHQAETQKIKQKLSNTLTLNVFYLEIMCFLDSVFYCINSGYWDKNNRAYSKICTQNRCVCLNDRSNHWRCSGKKVFLEISQNSQESNCTRVSVLIKLQASETFQTKFS